MRQRQRHWAAGLSIVGAATLLAPTAGAQTSPPARPPATKPAKPATTTALSVKTTTPTDPKKLLAAAKAKRAAGDFAGALADYQALDAQAPSPVAIEGIAFCNDKLGNFDQAVTWYEGFLASAPPAMQLEANEAEARVKAIKAMPGRLHLESAPSNATVVIDGKEQPTHTPLDVELAPGKHTLHLTAPDHDPVDHDVDVVSRTKGSLALELPLTPPPPPPPPPVVEAPPPPPPPPRSIIPAIVTGSAALIAAGVGIGGGVEALSDKSSFNNHPTTALANSGESAALVSDMGFGIAITLGVTSIVLFTTRNEHDTPATAPASAPPAKASASSPSFAAAPFVTPHGGGAGAVLSF